MTLSEFELGQLIAYKKQGYSGWAVQQKLLEIEVEISRNQINLLYRQRNNFKGKKPDLRGAKSLFTEENIEQIKQRIRSNRTITAADIMRSPTLNPNQASIRCVQNLVNKLGFKCRIAPSKPKLSDQNQDNRLEFANNLVEWSQESIEQIVFTEESKLFCKKNGKHLLRVNNGFKIPSKLFKKTEKQNGGQEIMVQGAIYSKGPLYLILINETLNGEGYKKLLIDFFKNSQYDIKTNIFQQDNFRIHQSNIVKKYLKYKKIDVLEWPSQSPDLNPIENIWSFLKNYLYKRRNNIKNIDDLWAYSQKGFFSSECSELITQLYSSYMIRIAMVIEKEGGNTKY